MQLWLCPLLALLMGSIPFGLLIAKSGHRQVIWLSPRSLTKWLFGVLGFQNRDLDRIYGFREIAGEWGDGFLVFRKAGSWPSVALA
jgi:hypothetical protein